MGKERSSVSGKGRARNLSAPKRLLFFFLRLLTSPMGLAFINSVYLAAGALIFWKIESPHESSVFTNLVEERKDLVKNLFDIVFTKAGTLKPLIGTDPKYIKLAGEALDNYEMSLAAFYRKRTLGGSAKNNSEATKLWTPMGSVIYAYSITTTIGWGNIVPTTMYGRLATILYGFVGVPLVFTFSSEVVIFNTKTIRVFTNLMSYRCWSGADKSMNRNVRSGQEPDMDTAIKLVGHQNSGYNHPPRASPSQSSGGHTPAQRVYRPIGGNGPGHLGDPGGGGDYHRADKNANYRYLTSVASTLDFLLEVSQNTNAWRKGDDLSVDGRGRCEGEDGGGELKRREVNKLGDEARRARGSKSKKRQYRLLVEAYEKPRYKMRTMDDALKLSEEFGRLSADELCRIMKFVGFDFERDVVHSIGNMKDINEQEGILNVPVESGRKVSRQKRERGTRKKSRLEIDCRRSFEKNASICDGNRFDASSQRERSIWEGAERKAKVISEENETSNVYGKNGDSTITCSSQSDVEGASNRSAWKHDKKCPDEGHKCDISFTNDDCQDRCSDRNNPQQFGTSEDPFERGNLWKKGDLSETASNFHIAEIKSVEGSSPGMLGGGDGLRRRGESESTCIQNCKAFTSAEEGMIGEERPIESESIPISIEDVNLVMQSPCVTSHFSSSVTVPPVSLAVSPTYSDKLVTFDDNVFTFPNAVEERGKLSHLSRTVENETAIKQPFCSSMDSNTLGMNALQSTSDACLNIVSKATSGDLVNTMSKPAFEDYSFHSVSKVTNGGRLDGPRAMNNTCYNDTDYDAVLINAGELSNFKGPKEIYFVSRLKDTLFGPSRPRQTNSPTENMETAVAEVNQTENESAQMKSSHEKAVKYQGLCKQAKAALTSNCNQWCEYSENTKIVNTARPMDLDRKSTKHAIKCSDMHTAQPECSPSCECPLLSVAEQRASGFIAKNVSYLSQYSQCTDTQSKHYCSDSVKATTRSYLVESFNKLPRDAIHSSKDLAQIALLRDSSVRGFLEEHTVDYHQVEHYNLGCKMSTKNKSGYRTGSAVTQHVSSKLNIRRTHIHVSSRIIERDGTEANKAEGGCMAENTTSKKIDSLGLKFPDAPTEEWQAIADGTFAHQAHKACVTKSSRLERERLGEFGLSKPKPTKINQCADQHGTKLKKERVRELEISYQKSATNCQTELARGAKPRLPKIPLQGDSLQQKTKLKIDKSKIQMASGKIFKCDNKSEMKGNIDRFISVSDAIKLPRDACEGRERTSHGNDFLRTDVHISNETRQNKDRGVSSYMLQFKEPLFQNSQDQPASNEVPDDSLPPTLTGFKNRRRLRQSRCQEWVETNFGSYYGKRHYRGRLMVGGDGLKCKTKIADGQTSVRRDKIDGHSNVPGQSKIDNTNQGEQLHQKLPNTSCHVGAGHGVLQVHQHSEKGQRVDTIISRDEVLRWADRCHKQVAPASCTRQEERSHDDKPDIPTYLQHAYPAMSTNRGHSQFGPNLQHASLDDLRRQTQKCNNQCNTGYYNDGHNSTRSPSGEKDADANLNARGSETDNATREEGGGDPAGEGPDMSPMGIWALFGLTEKKKKRKKDRWAAFRPKDDRTLQEDLKLLKITIGTATAVDEGPPEEDVDPPLIFTYLGMGIFMALGAFLHIRINHDINTWLESFYFVYVLCSTTGFGDILPHPESYPYELVYCLLGVSMFNITVNATLNYMISTLDYIKHKCRTHK